MKVPALAVLSPRSAPVAFTSELRPVGRRDVLLEVLYCGLCHADLDRLRSTEGRYPVVPGHEMSAGWWRWVGEFVDWRSVSSPQPDGSPGPAAGATHAATAMPRDATRPPNRASGATRRTPWWTSDSCSVSATVSPRRRSRRCFAPGRSSTRCSAAARPCPGDRVAVLGTGVVADLASKLAAALGAAVDRVELPQLAAIEGGDRARASGFDVVVSAEVDSTLGPRRSKAARRVAASAPRFDSSSATSPSTHRSSASPSSGASRRRAWQSRCASRSRPRRCSTCAQTRESRWTSSWSPLRTSWTRTRGSSGSPGAGWSPSSQRSPPGEGSSRPGRGVLPSLVYPPAPRSRTSRSWWRKPCNQARVIRSSVQARTSDSGRGCGEVATQTSGP